MDQPSPTSEKIYAKGKIDPVKIEAFQRPMLEDAIERTVDRPVFRRDTMLISCADTLKMMETLAPRAWCKKVILNLISHAQLMPIFEKAEIIRYEYATADERKQQDKDWRSSLIEERKVGENFYRQVSIVDTWDEAQEFESLAAFDYVNTCDWELGNFETDFLDTNSNEFGFSDDHCGKNVRFVLYGLHFYLHQVEMLVPTASTPHATNLSALPIRRDIGAPRKWDWDGSLIDLIAHANRPDGLPNGAGAQAAIERIMGDWFISQTGNTPAPSEIRLRAAKVMAALKS